MMSAFPPPSLLLAFLLLLIVTAHQLLQPVDAYSSNADGKRTRGRALRHNYHLHRQYLDRGIFAGPIADENHRVIGEKGAIGVLQPEEGLQGLPPSMAYVDEDGYATMRNAMGTFGL